MKTWNPYILVAVVMAVLVIGGLLGHFQFIRANERAIIVANRIATEQVFTKLPENATTTDLEERLHSEEFFDPYTRRALLLRQVDGVVYVYSVGPDRADDHAEILYDPTNGVVSKGDLVTSVVLTN